MVTGRLLVDEAEVRKSQKSGNNYGFVSLVAVGVSSIDIFTTEVNANALEVGQHYDFIFKMKGKEIDGIKSFKKVVKK